MKAKEVLLLILIVAVGVLLYLGRTGGLQFHYGWNGPFGSRTFSFEDTVNLEAPIPPRIEISNAYGEVEVRGADQGTVTGTFIKDVRRRKEAQAREVAGALKPVITREAGVLRIATNRDAFAKKGFDTGFRLLVPAGSDVVVVNSYGNVAVSGVRKAAIEDRHGRVEVTDVAEDVSVANTYENVAASRIGGACRISSGHADALVREVGGDVRIDHGYGSVEVRDAGAGVTIVAQHSRITLLRVKGPADVQTNYEDVSLVNVGPATIRGVNTSVEADGIDGALKVMTTYDRVRANNVRGDFDVEGKSVGVTARAVAAGVIRIATSYGNLDLADFTGRTDVELSHASAVLAPAAISSPIVVNNSYGTIRFIWPAGIRVPVEARSKGGDVKWNLPDPPDLASTNGETLVKAFAGAAQGASVTLATSYADVVIELPAPKK